MAYEQNWAEVTFSPRYRSTEGLHEESLEDVFQPTANLKRSPIQRRKTIITRSKSKSASEAQKLPIQRVEDKSKLVANHRNQQKPQKAEETQEKEEIRQEKLQEKEDRKQDSTPYNANMNVTIQDAGQSARPPAVPSFVSPETFNPGQSNPLAFIQKYERCALANGWDNAYKINYLGTFLEKAAYLWYKKYRNTVENRNKTWENIIEDFLEKFEVKGASRSAKLRLRNRRQGQREDIQEYFYSMVCLADEVDPNMQFSDFLELFEDGLHSSHLQTYFLTKGRQDIDMNTLEDVIKNVSQLMERYNIGHSNQEALLTERHYEENTRQPREQHPSRRTYNRLHDTAASHSYNRQLNSPRSPFSGPKRNNSRNGPEEEYYSHRNEFNGPKREYSGPRREINNGTRKYEETRKSYNDNRREANTNIRRNMNIPQTRTSDGRPYCHLCKKPGHHPSLCYKNGRPATANQGRTNPNFYGRHN